jgi:hypothetical protein
MDHTQIHDVRATLEKEIKELKQYMNHMKRAQIKDRTEKHKVRLEMIRRQNALNDLDNGRLFFTQAPDGGFMVGRYTDEDVEPIIQRRLESLHKPTRFTTTTTNVDENAGPEAASDREVGDGVLAGENGQAESASAGQFGPQC